MSDPQILHRKDTKMTTVIHVNQEVNENSTLRSDPDSACILGILDGAFRYKIMIQAIELGIFDELEANPKPLTARALANKKDFNLLMTEKLLNSLSCIGLLKKTKGKDGIFTFENTMGSSRYLTRSRQPTMLPLVLMSDKALMPMMNMVQPLMHTGPMKPPKPSDTQMQKPQINSSGPTQVLMPMGKYKGNTDDDKNNNKMPPQMPPPDKTKMFMGAMDGISCVAVHDLVRAFDLRHHRNAVDLGGSSGLIGCELANMYPEMNVTSFDFSHVTQMAEKMRPVRPKNLQFEAGDFLRDEIPQADIYIMSHVIHCLNDKEIDLILGKVFKKLPRGGSLMVMEKALDEDKSTPEYAIVNDVILSLQSEGRERSLGEYKRLFKKHGFTNFNFKPLEGLNMFDVMLLKKPF